MLDKRIKGMRNRITQEYRVPIGNLLHSHGGAVVLVHVLAVGLFLGKLLIGELTEGVLAGDNAELPAVIKFAVYGGHIIHSYLGSFASSAGTMPSVLRTYCLPIFP